MPTEGLIGRLLILLRAGLVLLVFVVSKGRANGGIGGFGGFSGRNRLSIDSDLSRFEG